MVRYAITILLMFYASISYSSETTWEVSIRDDGTAVILESRNEGFDSLEEAVLSIPKDAWISDVRVSALLEKVSFQEELHTYMMVNHPTILKEALGSAGNMHNPKVIKLHEAFRKSILYSKYVKELNSALSARCEEISGASFEKFEIYKPKSKPVYTAMIWLSTERCT